MSFRFFEGQDHAKIYAQFRPSPPPELIQRLVEFLREKYDGPLNLAVDLGCGNGQCAFTLANDFSSVLGTDISPAQISQARELCSSMENCGHVKFEAAPAEKTPVADSSVQLVTICEAAHWMDLPKVYEDCRRILVKNGVLAIVGYLLPKYAPVVVADRGKADAINKVIDERSEEIVKYWPKQAFSVLREYEDVTIPFSDFTRERGYSFVRKVKISDILGGIRTHSPFQLLTKDKGEEAGNEILQGITDELTAVLNEGREKPLTTEEIRDYEFTASYHYFVCMARL